MNKRAEGTTNTRAPGITKAGTRITCGVTTFLFGKLGCDGGGCCVGVHGCGEDQAVHRACEAIQWRDHQLRCHAGQCLWSVCVGALMGMHGACATETETDGEK